MTQENCIKQQLLTVKKVTEGALENCYNSDISMLCSGIQNSAPSSLCYPLSLESLSLVPCAQLNANVSYDSTNLLFAGFDAFNNESKSQDIRLTCTGIGTLEGLVLYNPDVLHSYHQTTTGAIRIFPYSVKTTPHYFTDVNGDSSSWISTLSSGVKNVVVVIDTYEAGNDWKLLKQRAIEFLNTISSENYLTVLGVRGEALLFPFFEQASCLRYGLTHAFPSQKCRYKRYIDSLDATDDIKPAWDVVFTSVFDLLNTSRSVNLLSNCNSTDIVIFTNSDMSISNTAQVSSLSSYVAYLNKEWGARISVIRTIQSYIIDQNLRDITCGSNGLTLLAPNENTQLDRAFSLYWNTGTNDERSEIESQVQVSPLYLDQLTSRIIQTYYAVIRLNNGEPYGVVAVDVPINETLDLPAVETMYESCDILDEAETNLTTLRVNLQDLCRYSLNRITPISQCKDFIYTSSTADLLRRNYMCAQATEYLPFYSMSGVTGLLMALLLYYIELKALFLYIVGAPLRIGKVKKSHDSMNKNLKQDENIYSDLDRADIINSVEKPAQHLQRATASSPTFDSPNSPNITLSLTPVTPTSETKLLKKKRNKNVVIAPSTPIELLETVVVDDDNGETSPATPTKE
jgi:hypothetical protein